MEPEQRGRASRASSTSSLGREVRCGCQYYQSDSLLPERRALLGRPPSRTMQQPPAVRCSEHEYEPIAPPPPAQSATAPVVRITETDVLPVADSDDSIDDRGRITPGLILDGDVVLPLDGRIEDSAMEGRELVATGDTSEELESPQQLQERLEERFLTAATPCTESRTDGEINTSQVDSSALEELPLRRGARGLPQRIKSQAGKLRSRLRGFQRPTFSFPDRQKPDKARSASSGRSDKSKSPRGERRPSRMDRLRSSFSERPKFSLPARPKFNLPDRSKFHLPERPKFSLPERPKFHLDKSKFNIKKPNIRLPSALSRTRKPSSTREPHSQRSTESTVGSKRNIFDFSTYPRIFDRKSKNRGDYATSSPKDSRAQSAESATFPRAKKGISARWAQRWAETGNIDDDRPNAETIVERSHPWRHPSMEEPRLSVRMEEEILAAAAAIPWEKARKKVNVPEEELQYMDYEQESPETSDRQAQPTSQEASRTEEESYDPEQAQLDPRLYGDQGVRYGHPRKNQGIEEREDWRTEEETMMVEGGLRPIQRSKSLDEHVAQDPEDDRYEGSFPPVDPRRFGPPKLPSEEEGYEEDMEEADEEREPSSVRSDREQQSSGSSCDRRRRGVIEEIDSDEFFLRQSGLSQDDMTLGKYLASEIRDALRSETGNALADDEIPSVPPKRPMRSRSLRKRKEGSVESYDAAPPARPKRERPAMRRSESSTDAPEAFRERTRSGSRHRVVYQAESSPRERTPLEPLDDIVVVKPARRKSRTSSRSQSQAPVDSTLPSSVLPTRSATPSPAPPIVPTRRKRSHRETAVQQRDNVAAMCNGHRDWLDGAPEKPLPSAPSKESLEDAGELAKDIMATSEVDVRELVMRLRDEDYVEPVPVPPKRRSRSRGTSVAQDEDRTSHGAESLPEAGYMEEDIPRDESLQDLPGYAVIEKRDKPPRPPPPRRRRDKFATTPRPTAPKRPVRAYSTLGPSKSRDTSIMSESVSMTLEPTESMRYIEIDSDDPDHKDLRSGQVLSKMQGRPLPAPPRPPRARKEHGGRMIEEFAMEATTATQTDPLPEDMIIEEEITQAKLVVAPSQTGSQVLVSMERIPSPAGITTPPVPPLPVSQFMRRDEEPSYDTVSLKSPSPVREHENVEERHLSAPHLQEPLHSDDETRGRSGIAALLADDTLRIGSLEVGDLRVDRLSVSQIEAHKIIASEVDAMVIAASELRSIAGGEPEESLSPAIIKELIAIRSHLESVAASQMQERAELEARMLAAVHEKTVIPVKEERGVREEERSAESASSRDAAQVEEKSEPGKDEKVVKTEVKDREIRTPHTLSVAQVEIETKELPVTRTLSVARPDSRDKETPITHPPPYAEDTQERSLRILDSDSPLSLSPSVGSAVEVPRASLPPSSGTMSSQTAESRPPTEADKHRESDTGPPDSVAPTSRPNSEERSHDSTDKTARKSRSRSPSPSKGITCAVRQTASPVRSLPPVISVTPDTPDTPPVHGKTGEPQRAVISYSSHTERSHRDTPQRESSQSPPPSLPMTGAHFIAFPASQIPARFFSMAEEPSRRLEAEPSVTETTLQLLRSLRFAGVNAMRHFIGYLASHVGTEDSRDKIKEVELTLCALLLLIAGMLIYFLGSERTVTYHHHWDYFNPPK